MRARLLALVGALLLAGCDLETPAMTVVTDVQPVVDSPDPDAVAIPSGAAVACTPFLSRDEIEGGPTLLPVDDLRADDPTMVRISRATREYQIQWPNTNEHAFVLFGLAPGRSTLRLYRDGDEAGSLPVVVVAQEP